MVKIRLQRVGAKKQPHYHIVVADSKIKIKFKHGSKMVHNLQIQ